MELRLYLDEDSMDQRLVRALRARGLTWRRRWERSDRVVSGLRWERSAGSNATECFQSAP